MTWKQKLEEAVIETLKGEHPIGEAHDFALMNQIEQLYFKDALSLEVEAEIRRAQGQSGILAARQYNYDYAGTVGYAPLNMHNHGNYSYLVGLAEFNALIHGYYIRTRHNDYPIRLGGKLGQPLGPLVPHLPVPSDVTGSLTNQINKVKDYLRVLEGDLPQSAVANFGGAFEWLLAYMEVWFEYLTDPDLEDPFDSDRHQIDSSTVEEMIYKTLYYNITGHKNRLENTPVFPTVLRDVDAKGRPVFAIMKYRIKVVPVGSIADYPIKDILALRETAMMNRVRPGTMRDRYRLRSSKDRDMPDDWSQPGLLDTFMAKVPGLNGPGANLVERYDDVGEYNINKFRTNTPLNAAYYNRFYSQGFDASGRDNARRGFNDPSLFVASTDVPKVYGKSFGTLRQSASYAIPLELLVNSFLKSWNPHGAIDGDAADLKFPPAKKGGSKADALPGFFQKEYFYKTPIELFQAEQDKDDPADTVSGSKWVKCSDGVARKHTASGHQPFLQSIPGIGRVRLRYPIYESYEEGNPELKERDERIRVLQARLDLIDGTNKKGFPGDATVIDQPPKGLIAAWLPGNNFNNYVSGGPNGTEVGEVEKVYVEKVDAWGAKVYAGSPNGRISLGAIDSAHPLSGVPSKELTVFAYLQFNPTEQYGRILDVTGDAAVKSGWVFGNKGNALKFQLGSPQSVGVSCEIDGLEAWQYYTISFSVKEGERSYGYLNGRAVGKYKVCQPFKPNVSQASLLGSAYVDNKRSLSPVFCIYVYDRRLSEQEHLKLHYDPFSFNFKPVPVP